MEQDVGVALGLGVEEGRVIAYNVKSRRELCDEARAIMDNAERRGAKKLDDLNDSEKDKMREIMKALGQDVRF